MLEQLKKEFADRYGDGAEPTVSFAPGRVNLIGEHTDYNGGAVFPCALEVGTYGLGRLRKDKEIYLHSLNYPNSQEWMRYPKAVLSVLEQELGKREVGMELLFYGNIPNGSGLSSSASLEVACGLLITALWGVKIERVKMAQLCQRAENEQIGVACGIMDQFASLMGRAGCAVWLNTADLTYEYVPFQSEKYAFLAVNSMVKHSLADSAYNKRREECGEAFKLLERDTNASSLCQITPEEFSKIKYRIQDPVLINRGEHAVTENQRTRDAVGALNNKDFQYFGNLMKESHDSLRRKYEVSCAELDFLVETACKMEGVLGARMTGGGFGGCSINLIECQRLEAVKKELKMQYFIQYGIEPETYPVKFGEGARIIP